MKLKKCIKYNTKCQKVYKIVNLDTGLFKNEGRTTECSTIGKTWYKLSDAKKAFNMLPNNYEIKNRFKIVRFNTVAKNIEIL